MGGRPAPGRSARPQGGADLRHLARRAEPVKLLRLGEAIPRGPQVLQRLRQFARAGFRAVEQARILDRHHRLVCKGSNGRKRSEGRVGRKAAGWHSAVLYPIEVSAGEIGDPSGTAAMCWPAEHRVGHLWFMRPKAENCCAPYICEKLPKPVPAR